MTRGRKKSLTPALEEYLTVIYEITKIDPVARVKDIAARLDVSLPSVTNAMKRLKDLGLVKYEKYGLIMLSDSGMNRSESLEKTQRVLKTFFEELVGVPEDVSTKLSCNLEHFFSAETEKRTEDFIQILLKIKKDGMPACKDLVDFFAKK